MNPLDIEHLSLNTDTVMIAHYPDDPPPRWHNPVLALGNFDGLHRGHMKIIDRVRRRAGERGGTPAVMTFDRHRPRIVRPDEASALLAHHYFVDGTVTRGAGRGRELGFPTANLTPPNELLPPSGVYATTATINGIAYPSVTNVGMRPTFGDVDRVQVETHLLDAERDLYDAPLRVSFVQRLRDERAFSDVDALRAQIEADCRAARRLFGRISL